MPFIAQVSVGKREFLSVYGNDYDTPDGTGMLYFKQAVIFLSLQEERKKKNFLNRI